MYTTAVDGEAVQLDLLWFSERCSAWRIGATAVTPAPSPPTPVGVSPSVRVEQLPILGTSAPETQEN